MGGSQIKTLKSEMAQFYDGQTGIESVLVWGVLERALNC